jgi:cholinesterase
MHTVILSLAALASAIPLESAQQITNQWTVGQTVKTTSGSIVGHAASWQKEVSEYLGVPYAKPPVGPLRFAPPQRYESTEEVVAARFSPSCPANVLAKPEERIPYTSPATTVGGILAQAGDTFDEDCLTVNVWSKPQTGEKSKAVMYTGPSKYVSQSLTDIWQGVDLWWWIQHRQFSESGI